MWRQLPRIGEISRAVIPNDYNCANGEKERRVDPRKRSKVVRKSLLVVAALRFCPGRPRAGGSTSHSRQVRITTSTYVCYTHPRFPGLFTLTPPLSHGGSPSVPSWSVGVVLWTRSRNPIHAPLHSLTLEFCIDFFNDLDTILSPRSIHFFSSFLTFFFSLVGFFEKLLYFDYTDFNFFDSKTTSIQDRNGSNLTLPETLMAGLLKIRRGRLKEES